MNTQSISKTVGFQDTHQNQTQNQLLPAQQPIETNSYHPQQQTIHSPTNSQPNPNIYQHSQTPQPTRKVKVTVRPQPNYVTSTRSRVQNTQTASAFRNTAYVQNLAKEKTLQQFRESLYFDERINKVPKSTVHNQIIDSIVGDADMLLQKQPLLDSIYKLKQLNLLRSKDFAVNKLPGIGKSTFVYNDYHTKSTNNGYSRNFGGVFYTR